MTSNSRVDNLIFHAAMCRNPINCLYNPGHVTLSCVEVGPVAGLHPYLCMVGRFRGDDPRFGDFRSDWVPILYLSTIRLTPSFCRKNRFVSITFSSRDIRT